MLKKLSQLLYHDIGIDLGTKNTVVYTPKKGVILNEPSVIAFDNTSGKVLSVGEEAQNMVGRTPGNIIAVRPMKNGVITDFEIAEKMIKYFITKTITPSPIKKPRILIGIPWGITPVEKHAVLEASKHSGATKTNLIEEPMAAAIGAGLPVTNPIGSMIVDIGGGTTEVGIISLGSMVACKSIRLGGDALDQAIINHCRKYYNLLIGERSAERIKIDIGSAFPLKQERNIQVKGRDFISGLPKKFSISSYEIRDALSESIQTMIQTIHLILDQAPPDISSDISNNGITLTGGGALLSGLANRIHQETSIKITVAENPLMCVAKGTGEILNNKKLLSKIDATIY